MYSRFRVLYLASASGARIVLATMLLLVILAGVLPFSAISSAHMCSMPCCVGLAPHAAGSCHVNPSKQQNPLRVEMCGAMEMLPSAHGEMQVHEASAKDIAAPAHCATQENHSAAQSPTYQDVPSQTASVASLALTQPCQSDCGACSGNFAQLRRFHDAATLPLALRPRPPTLAWQSQRSDKLPYIPAAWRKSFRPRGPPVPSQLFINIA